MDRKLQKDKIIIYINVFLLVLSFLGLVFVFVSNTKQDFASHDSSADSKESIVYDLTGDELIDIEDMDLIIKSLKVCENPKKQTSQSSDECKAEKNLTPPRDLNSDELIDILDIDLMIKAYKPCNDPTVDDPQQSLKCIEYKTLKNNPTSTPVPTNTPTPAPVQPTQPQPNPTQPSNNPNPTQPPNNPPAGSGHCPPNARPHPAGYCEYGCYDESSGSPIWIGGSCNEVQQETNDCDACHWSGRGANEPPCFYSSGNTCIIGVYEDCRNCNHACCVGK
jgi:hypothetical protein